MLFEEVEKERDALEFVSFMFLYCCASVVSYKLLLLLVRSALKVCFLIMTLIKGGTES